MQIGSGSIDSTGYISTVVGLFNTAPVSGISSTSAFIVTSSTATTDTLIGAVQLNLLSGNTWICSGVVQKNPGNIFDTAGDKTLSGILDRIRITTVNGTDTFDAGSVNILYEG